MNENPNQQELSLEGRVTALEIRMAVAESNIKEFGKKLDKIDQNLSKVMWILIIAVIGAILNLVIKGRNNVMNNVITQLLLITIAIAPFVNALVGIVKKSFSKLQDRFYPLAALVSGLIVGFLFSFLPGVQYTVVQMIMAGGIAGMASCGVYQIATVTNTNTTKTDETTTSDTTPNNQ